MSKAIVKFNKLEANSIAHGTTDDYMVSRAHFSLEHNGTVHEDLYVDLKQVVGTSAETHPLEVSSPKNYNGPFNHEEFRKIAEFYYGMAIGSNAKGIKVSSDSSVVVTDSTFGIMAQADLEIGNDSGGW